MTIMITLALALALAGLFNKKSRRFLGDGKNKFSHYFLFKKQLYSDIWQHIVATRSS